MHLIFIGNPVAGLGSAKRSWPALEKKLLELGWRFDIYWSRSQDHICTLVDHAIAAQPDVIVSLGGDGTVHDVISSMYRQPIQTTMPVFTAFPRGTGNDWSRFWHIPHEIGPWIEMVRNFKSYTQDLGQIDYTDDHGNSKRAIFNNVAGMAYDAYVANYIESKKKKMAVGGIQYLWFIFRCLFGYKLQLSRLTWSDGSVQDYFYTINVGICPYSGGGLQLVPHALPDDGLLAVTAVRPLKKWQVPWMSRHFYTGRIHLHPKVVAFNTAEFQIISTDPTEIIQLEADGEYLGRLPAKFSVWRSALKLCAP